MCHCFRLAAGHDCLGKRDTKRRSHALKGLERKIRPLHIQSALLEPSKQSSVPSSVAT